MGKRINEWQNVSGTLVSSTYIEPAVHKILPLTVTLKSSDAARKIELSTDGGIEYFVPPYSQTSSTLIVVTIDAPVTHIKFTGATNDTWGVL